MRVEVMHRWKVPSYKQYISKISELKSYKKQFEDAFCNYTQNVEEATRYEEIREAVLDYILTELLSIYPQFQVCPVTIWLSGSYSRGYTNGYSDLDLNLKTHKEFHEVIVPLFLEIRYALSYIYEIPFERVHTIEKNFIFDEREEDVQRFELLIKWADTKEKLKVVSKGQQAVRLMQDLYTTLDWKTGIENYFLHIVESPYREWLFSIKAILNTNNELPDEMYRGFLFEKLKRIQSSEVLTLAVGKICMRAKEESTSIMDLETVGETRYALKTVFSKVILCCYLVFCREEGDLKLSLRDLMQKVSYIESAAKIHDLMLQYEQNMGFLYTLLNQCNGKLTHRSHRLWKSFPENERKQMKEIVDLMKKQLSFMLFWAEEASKR